VSGVLRVRVSLVHLDPAPRRTFLIAADQSLLDLHAAIQAVFLWNGMHLWMFAIDGKTYEPRDPEHDEIIIEEAQDAAMTRLGDVLREKAPPALYTYDFGDDWTHLVEVLERREMTPGEDLPAFLDGAFATPPEDIGGPPMYELFQEAIAAPKHRQHAWATEVCPVDWAPDEIHREVIETTFAGLRAKASLTRPVRP
jgi:hypothetical protein